MKRLLSIGLKKTLAYDDTPFKNLQNLPNTFLLYMLCCVWIFVQHATVHVVLQNTLAHYAIPDSTLVKYQHDFIFYTWKILT